MAYSINFDPCADNKYSFIDPKQHKLSSFSFSSAAYVYVNIYNARIIYIFHALSVSVVYFSESINEYAAQNWKTFSKQQYFDDNGLFISTVFSIPILLNCMLLIVSIENVYVSLRYPVRYLTNSLYDLTV